MPGTRERLEAASAARELVGCIYDGGSQPGRYRRIRPNVVTADLVWATCQVTGKVRQFRVALLTLVDADPATVPRAMCYAASPEGKP